MKSIVRMETPKRKGRGVKAVAAADGPKAGTPRKLDESSLQKSLRYSLRRAQVSTFREFSEVMEGDGVRPSQYAVLVLIRSNPGLSQSAVSHALAIQKANLVTLLDGLERRRWTERHRVPGDRRASALHLTPEGEQFVSRMEAAHQEMEKRLTRRLGSVKSALLLKLLHEFSAARPEG